MLLSYHETFSGLHEMRSEMLVELGRDWDSQHFGFEVAPTKVKQIINQDEGKIESIVIM